MREIKNKVLFDSNVLIDVLTQRENSLDSINCFIKMADDEFVGYVCAKQITDIYYVLKKYLVEEKRNDAIGKLLSIFNIIDLNVNDLKRALQIEGRDYEDKVLIAVAERNNLNFILSKDKGGFSNSQVKMISPSDYLKILKDKQD